MGHWDDVRSDLSAIHHYGDDEIDELTPRQFWPKAVRLVHYAGCVREVALVEYRKSQASGSTPQQDQPESVPSTQVEPETGELIDPTPEQIRALRDRARRKRYPKDKYGDVRYVTAEEITREASRNA